MRRAASLVLLLVAACPEKAPPPKPPPPPKPKPAEVDAGPPAPARPIVRPTPLEGKVTKLDDGSLQLSGHTESILAVTFDPSGTRAATGGLDRSVRVWDVAKGTELYRAGPFDESVTALRFDPKGAVLAVGTRAFQVQLLDATTGAVLRVRAHPDTVSSLSFSPDGKWLAVAGSGGSAEVYPAGTDEPSKCELRGRTVDFTDDGKNVVGAAPSGNLNVLSFPQCKKVKETSTSPHLPFGAASATAALIGTRNGAEPFVLLWDALQGRMLGKLDRQEGGVTSLQLSADGKRALVGSADRHVRLYDVEKHQVLKTVETGDLPFAAMNSDATKAIISEGLTARVVSLAP